MMDHVRHLSSPSPTSPLLFHHSERPFRSNSLTPLLSSVSDVTNSEDCLAASTRISQPSPSLFDGHNDNNGSQTHEDSQSHRPSHLSHHDNHCVIDQDSLADVDDDDGMHMLSGSSASSNSTIPLLTESHSHHSFSRISLEEYSPLSLVEECDNALPISPTSLACGSFKSTLNGCLKDNLVGDVGEVGHEDTNVHDDVVNDGVRSMSPSLMSTSTNNHLWSNSSTAITQSTSLLSNTSSSFLLSHHHHHHQLNSLIQQLEPQSLDEPPPLTVTTAPCGSLSFDNNLTALAVDTDRPSSEPPPGANISGPGLVVLKDPEIKFLSSQPVRSKSKPKTSNTNSKSSVVVSAGNASTTPSRVKRNRSRSSSLARQQPGTSKASTSSAQKKSKDDASSIVDRESLNSSKVHLQLNYKKKLQELQERLFGKINSRDSKACENGCDDGKSSSEQAVEQAKGGASNSVFKAPCKVKQEPDSSGKNESTVKSGVSGNNKRNRQPKARASRAKASVSMSQSNDQTSSRNDKSNNPTQVTTETAEPDTTTKSSECIKLADLLSSGSGVGSNNQYSISKSDDIAGQTRFTNSLEVVTDNANDNSSDRSEKRVQQIQLQVTPSLTVVTNGNLVQQIGIQQQQQPQQQQQQSQQQNTITNGSNFANQLLCRPHTVLATSGGQLKGFISNADVLKTNETPSGLTLTTTSNQNGNLNQTNISGNNSVSNNNGQANQQNATFTANGQSIGTHQIAIQVICQDGTSLVLPVSSATGLNAAVSLTSQNPQLQAVFANGNGSTNRLSGTLNQLMPIVSMPSFVTQQQVNMVENSNNGVSTANDHSSNGQSTANGASGLAASSPTLAALLDAGTVKPIGRCELTGNGTHCAQSFVSANLLRKLVSGAGGDSKKSEPTTITLHQGSTLGVSNCGSLVTFCTTNGTATMLPGNKATFCTSSDGKRVKLEPASATVDLNEIQGATGANFTLIDTQGLIVTTGNDTNAKANAGQDQIYAVANASIVSQSGNQKSQLQMPAAKSNNIGSDPNKQSKMGSSTGNRQVDPTQPFRCEHCNSTFTRLGNFTRHKKIHTVPTKDGQRFKCDVCSKSFLQRCDLARHLHIHRGTEPHRCNICGKGYIRHSDLVTHQRFHNKEKPFGCPHCSKGFCQRGDLNRHLRSIHLQMKPILCPCCNKKFAKQETLVRHLNTAHRGPTST